MPRIIVGKVPAMDTGLLSEDIEAILLEDHRNNI